MEFWSMEINLGTIMALLGGLMLGFIFGLLALKPKDKKMNREAVGKFMAIILVVAFVAVPIAVGGWEAAIALGVAVGIAAWMIVAVNLMNGHPPFRLR